MRESLAPLGGIQEEYGAAALGRSADFLCPGGDEPVYSRLAYVSISRGRYDAQIYTNGAEKLGEELSRDVSKRSAMELM
ncbi:MAG: hypothetical protein ACLQVL_07475 [Terriglobia bacterium]